MNGSADRDYYTARAASARDLARRAASPSIAAIHTELASRYEALAVRPDGAAPSIAVNRQAA